MVCNGIWLGKTRGSAGLTPYHAELLVCLSKLSIASDHILSFLNCSQLVDRMLHSVDLYTQEHAYESCHFL